MRLPFDIGNIRKRHPGRQNKFWKGYGKTMAMLATIATMFTGFVAFAVPAHAATTLQITNLQHNCGQAGFTGHTDFTGGTDTATYSLQAHVNDPNYPDDFLAGTFSTTSGEYHADNDFQNVFGAQAVPPDTPTSVTFTVYDTSDASTVATLDSVLPACTAANSPPVGNDDTATTTANQPVTVNVLQNDSDADGNTLTVTNLTQPAHGTALLNSDKTVTYTPNQDFTGQDNFTYTPNDGTVDGNVTTATITVNAATPPPNSPPTVSAGPDLLIDRNIGVVISGSSASDPENDPLTLNWSSDSSNCTVSPTNVLHPTVKAGTGVGLCTLTVKANDGHNPDAASTMNVRVEYEPNFGISRVACAPPHTSNGLLSEHVQNVSDGGGTSSYVVKVGSTSKTITLADGASTNVSFNLPAGNFTVYISRTGVGGATVHQGISITTCTVVKFAATIYKYAVKSGANKGKAEVKLNNYWSGTSVTIYVRDGYGTLHKYVLSRFQVKYVFVPTPRGSHKVTVYRYYSGSKHVVTYRYVIR